jgi:hypothetical protein
MQNAADILEVRGNASFNGGNESGRLTEGVVKVTGNFTQSCSTSNESYQSSSHHRTLLNGTSIQNVAFGSCAGASYFNRVEFANPAGANFTSAVTIQDSTVVSGPVTGVGTTITLNGDFADSGSSQWQPENTVIGSGTHTFAGTLRSTVRFTNSTSLGSNIAVDGNVISQGGSLTLNGHKLSMTRNFTANTSAFLNMSLAGDTLAVDSSATFDGGNNSGRLTGGVVLIGKNFTQSCSTGNESYQASGTHKTVFNGGGTQQAIFGSCAGASYFNDVDVAGADVRFTTLVVNHNLNNLSGGHLTINSSTTTTVNNNLSLLAGSTTTNNGTLRYHGTLTNAGTYSGTAPVLF